MWCEYDDFVYVEKNSVTMNEYVLCWPNVLLINYVYDW